MLVKEVKVLVGFAVMAQSSSSLLSKAASPYADQSFVHSCPWAWHMLVSACTGHSWDDVVTDTFPSRRCWILCWRRFQAFSTFKMKDNGSYFTELHVMQMYRPFTDGIMSVWPVSVWPPVPTACWAPHWRALLACCWTTGSAAGAGRPLWTHRLALWSLTLPERTG